jgi:hypothetical protein
MYPVLFSASHVPEDRNRLTVFFRFILVIPWAIVATFYGLAATVAAIIAWFALVFTGRYPDALYDFNAGFVRFYGRVLGWTSYFNDEWPPFGGAPDDSFPVRTRIAPPKDEYSRLKAFFRLIYGIPVAILTYVMQLISGVIGFLTWIWMTITATHPEGLYKPMRAAIAYQVKAYAFWLLLTEDYPPFWAEEADELAGFTGEEPAPPPAPPPPPSTP